jgi:4'-phosphopantetheinyl transferase
MNKILWKKPPNKLFSDQSELHIWRFELSLKCTPYEKLISILSMEEIQRAKNFYFEKHYFQYLATHIIKRLILAEYLDVSPKLLEFEKGRWGKPALLKTRNSKNIQFNISHSHNLILIAVTVEDLVGIDVEYHAEKIPIKSLNEAILSTSEKKFFLKLKDQEKSTAFFRCWTRKEAYLKAIGIGMSINLANISVDINEFPAEDWIKINKNEIVQWKLFPFDAANLYTSAAVAKFPKHLLGYDAMYLL